MKLVLSVLCIFLFVSNLSGQDIFKDSRDSSVYRIFTVNGVTWMGENLNYKAVDGALYFEKDTNNSNAYGVLYNWESAMKACPVGWHLPTGEDFRNLANFFEYKETWGDSESDKNTFGIQLGGLQDYEGTFIEMGESGYYWTATEYDSAHAEYFSYLLIDNKKVIDISREADIVDIHGTEKSNKYSVRCVKDE